ncbi:ferredoxin [Synechococcus sp. PCC 7502]|uniref:(2Fe-2S) ferredoxin domain-containing protein n=1 Tax=Synechococcus sp. PCC 7502 TaxID=1173263 RepID=UPI00029FCC3A|nr:ferredoxin [Synechococcus sp. PCC 7502]AFY73291.1 ferredoxin [Synechococcus sp. PCC 7502]
MSTVDILDLRNLPNLPNLKESLHNQVKKLNIDKIQKHLFLCADQTKPLCCSKQISLDSWDYLKRRLKELNLETYIFRTKANCLRVCGHGPILVVYPDRIWYHSVTIPVVERIIQEHIIGGQVVEEFSFYGVIDSESK